MGVGYRGRLLFPMLARIGRLDTASTAGPQEDGQQKGYDEDFREPVRVQDGSQEGHSSRKELEPLDLLCQVEDEVWEQMLMLPTGNSPVTRVTLVFHFRDLEEAQLVDVNGDPLAPRVGDRLLSIHRVDGTLVQAAPPRLFCTQSVPRSYGLSSKTRNLLASVFESRDTSVSRS